MRPRRPAVARRSAAPPRGWLSSLQPQSKKKAAWFPRRPFLSYGGSTLTGDFRTSAPGAYLPAVSYSVAAANRGSRELWPETDAMVSHLRKMTHWAITTSWTQGCGDECPHCPRCSQATNFVIPRCAIAHLRARVKLCLGGPRNT